MKSIDVQWLGRIEYGASLNLQNRLVEQYLDAVIPESLLLLEHEPVYTIGRTRDQSSLRGASQLPYPVFEINRGGQATWHGPGQLVAYPILNLDRMGRDLHRYMRFLEEIIILTCGDLGVKCHRREGLTGVWVGQKKIASIGVGVRRWVTMHGLALNVHTTSLEPFLHITPCGIAGVEMTCLESECRRSLHLQTIADLLAQNFLTGLARLSETEPMVETEAGEPAPARISRK